MSSKAGKGQLPCQLQRRHTMQDICKPSPSSTLAAALACTHLGVAALLVADEHEGGALDAADAADHGGVVQAAAVAVQLHKLRRVPVMMRRVHPAGRRGPHKMEHPTEGGDVMLKACTCRPCQLMLAGAPPNSW